MILGCSKDKAEVGRCEARHLYTGDTFVAGREIADHFGIPILILSAKYGLIDPTTYIDWYNETFKRLYGGPFPDAPLHGFYLGGMRYFANAPARFEPLIVMDNRGRFRTERKRLRNNLDIVARMIADHQQRLHV
jgi:hypothetical protein